MICTPVDPACARCPVSGWCTDPSFYQPPPRQSPYPGSVRQARAHLLKALAAGEAIQLDGLHPRYRQAAEALAGERSVRLDDGHLRLVSRLPPSSREPRHSNT